MRPVQPKLSSPGAVQGEAKLEARGQSKQDSQGYAVEQCGGFPTSNGYVR